MAGFGRRSQSATHAVPPDTIAAVIIGIDFGARRVGVAVSDSGVLATPHSVIRNEGDVVETVARLGEQLQADSFVVGIPRLPRPSAGERRYREFADALMRRTHKTVVLWNEALSTVEAAGQLRARELGRREAQEVIDKHAAAVILQSYLDGRAGRTE